MRIQTLKRQTRAALALLLFMAPGFAGADISAFEFEKRAYHGCFFHTWHCVEAAVETESLENGKECIKAHEACAIETCKVNAGG